MEQHNKLLPASFESRPDREGIKTFYPARQRKFLNLFESRPDREGIKTSHCSLFIFFHRLKADLIEKGLRRRLQAKLKVTHTFESRPDREGIKTRARGRVYTPVRLKADLIEKGLRPSTNVAFVDSVSLKADLIEKGLRRRHLSPSVVEDV